MLSCYDYQNRNEKDDNISLTVFEWTCHTVVSSSRQQSGAAEACWAHNPEVDGSKPSSAIFIISKINLTFWGFALLVMQNKTFQEALLFFRCLWCHFQLNLTFANTCVRLRWHLSWTWENLSDPWRSQRGLDLALIRLGRNTGALGSSCGVWHEVRPP